MTDGASGKPMRANPAWKQGLGLLARLLVVAMIATAPAWGWVYSFYNKNFHLSVLFKPSIAILLGAGAGLAARLILRGKTGILKWLAAGCAVIFGLLFIHYGSHGMAGFWVFGIPRDPPNWDGIWQLSVGIVVASLILGLRRRVRQITPEPAPVAMPLQEPAPQPARSAKTATKPAGTRKPVRKAATKAVEGRKKKSAPKQSGGLAAATRKTAKKFQKEAGDTLKDAANSIKAGLHSVSQSLEKAGKHGKVIKIQTAESKRVRQEHVTPKTRPAYRHHSHRARISLVGTEEHRCPYCLEDVNPRDPAGVVTCPICHTMHHKVCWDVTGTCQVPHSQS